MDGRSQAGSVILLYSALEGLPDLHISGMWNAKSCRAVTMSTKNPASSRLGSCTPARPAQMPKCLVTWGYYVPGWWWGDRAAELSQGQQGKDFGAFAALLLPRCEIAATGEIQHAQPVRGGLCSFSVTIPSSHMTRDANVTCCMCVTAAPLIAQRCEAGPMAAAHWTDLSAATLD